MVKNISNIVKYVLIVVFVYYYVGNTAFVHTHVVDHFLVTHSHPYLPGMHHSHTEAQWETVSWFNLLCLDSSHELPIVPFIFPKFHLPVAWSKPDCSHGPVFPFTFSTLSCMLRTDFVI